MKYPSKIKIVENFKEFQIKNKGSLFIGQIYPVESEAEVSEILNSVKKRFYDATHHCFAFKLVDGKVKYSDDGEPSGTAGVRILNAIEHDSLFNQLIIVIRYFGGTKLGVGPLGKAYYNAANGVINSSEIKEKSLHQKISIESDFSQVSNIYHILNQNNAKIEKEEYSDKVRFEVHSLPSKINAICKFLIEISQNQVKIEQKIEFRYL
jgi:uncharacterized YigZ family protein